MNPASPVRIDPGTAVGPYVVERRLARGGMSVLYIARDADGRRIVLKMLPPGIATNSTRRRLMREARALAVVDHPGVVRVHGAGDHEGSPWIAMEYVHGIDLKRFIVDRGALPQEIALRYAMQAAEALVAAHEAGVVHRDLKPSNLLLAADGRIVLVDFGVAKRREDKRDGDVLTSAREVLGTPAYLSPEQLEHGLADERSDVWALGCVLYEMVVGTPPFGRGGSTTTAAILRDEPTFPAHVSQAIAQVISACLRKSSFARIGSPRELLSLLKDALDDIRSRPSNGERVSSSMPRASVRPSSVHPRVPTIPPSWPAQSVSSTIPPPRPDGSWKPAPPAVPRSSAPPRMPSVPAPTQRQSPLPPPPRSPAPPPRMATLPPARSAFSHDVAPHASPRSSGSMRVASPRGRIKGTAVRAGLAWFAEVYGEPALMQVYEAGSPELQAVLRPGDPAFGVMAASWYDTMLIGELLDRVDHVAAPADVDELFSRLALAIARDNVGGVYRALFRLVASPPLLEANAQRVWRTYCDEGVLGVRLRDQGSFVAHVRGWSRHHPTVCRMLRAMVEQVLRAIGYTALVVERTECVGEGASQCTWNADWIP